ncbi:unnamed protein product [Ixodes persulcatus]
MCLDDANCRLNVLYHSAFSKTFLRTWLLDREILAFFSFIYFRWKMLSFIRDPHTQIFSFSDFGRIFYKKSNTRNLPGFNHSIG